jgi:hypothetical protein
VNEEEVIFFTLHERGEMTIYKCFAYIITVVIPIKLIIRKCLKPMPYACEKGDVPAQVSCKFISNNIFEEYLIDTSLCGDFQIVTDVLSISLKRIVLSVILGVAN